MRPFVMLLWVLGCGMAQAGIYRCEKDGKTVLTDRACKAEAEPLTVRQPNLVTSTPGERMLARRYDQRIERDRQARDKADREWVRDHDASEGRKKRVREAVERHRVVQGMTPDEVRLALGWPESIDSAVESGGDIEQWFYRTGSGGKQVVTFRDGVVASASSDKKKRKKK